MPTVRNCSSITVSVWGRRQEKGHVSGKELYLDDISVGGVAEFPHHGALVIRVPDASGKGQRLAGPVHHPEFVLSGRGPLDLRVTAGRRGRCAAFSTMEVVLIVFCSLLAAAAIVVTVLLVLLRRHPVQRARITRGGGRQGSALGPPTRPLAELRAEFSAA